MKPAFLRWLCAALFAASVSHGETPGKWNGGAANGFIDSVLQRDDSIFATTDLGLYRAALSDKVWHKLPLPASAPMSGELAREAAPSPVLVYYTQHFYFSPSNDRIPMMYVSKDSGQTWECTSTGRNLSDVFVHSDGGLYADERMQTPTPPPRPDPSSSSWTTDASGQKLHIWHRVVVSHDFGKTWRDLSEGLSPEYEYYFRPDRSHPGLVRVGGMQENHPIRQRRYQADDASYHWKEIPWQSWRNESDEPAEMERSVFGSMTPGSNDTDARADLSSLFKYPFLKWGNGLDLYGVQIETEKPAYTFRQHEPMPVALKVFFVFTRQPLRFADNEDETICWALRGYPENGDTFFYAPAKADALSVGTPDHDAKFAAYKDDPGGRIVPLDDDHPYQRTIDLAKLYNFPGPGKYRVQPLKTFCSFFKGDASFAGQVIDVTITP